MSITAGKAVAATLLGALLAVAAVPQVSAAETVELSYDGLTYASTLSGTLFPNAGRLVPLESESQVFWVRNSAPDAAYLRLTLENPTWSDGAYASALAASARVPGKIGAPLALTTPGPCRVLLDGIRLGAGESVAVTVTLALANLNGLSGQDAAASMDLGVTLTETAGLAPGAGCSTPSVLVPLAPALREDDPATSAPPAPGEERQHTEPMLEGALLAQGWNQFGSALPWTWLSVLLGGAIFFLLQRRLRLGNTFDGEEVQP